MKNCNEPAFAFTDNRSSDYQDNECHYGLTKREYFVAMAMQGFCGKILPETSPDMIAQASIEIADAVLDKLEKNNPTT